MHCSSVVGCTLLYGASGPGGGRPALVAVGSLCEWLGHSRYKKLRVASHTPPFPQPRALAGRAPTLLPPSTARRAPIAARRWQRRSSGPVLRRNTDALRAVRDREVVLRLCGYGERGTSCGPAVCGVCRVARVEAALSPGAHKTTGGAA